MSQTRGSSLLACCLWAAISLTSGFIGIIGPAKLRLGVDQKIFILGEGVDDNDRDYTVTLSPSGALSHTFYRQTHTISSGVMTVINVNVSPSDIVSPTNGYVTLSVRSTSGDFSKTKNIQLDRSPGYLFIQLDKPVYTSGQRVKYRVVAIDEDMKWATWPVQISLLNPRGHLIERITKTAREAFKGSELALSKNPMTGDWKVMASYTNFTTNSAVTFEVRDYVLPRFSMAVKTNSSSVYKPESSPLKVTVKVEYVYGQPVQGEISVKVFARVPWAEHLIHEHQVYQLDRSGKKELIFDDEAIKDQTIMEYFSVEIYMAVNVTETGTGVVLKKEFRIATFADYPYEVTIVNRKDYFTPGLPYIVELEAVLPDGKVAKNVNVDLEAPGQETVTLRTNSKGRITREIITTQDMNRLDISYGPSGLPDHMRPSEIRPVVFPTENQFMVSLVSNPRTDRDLQIKIRYRSELGKYFVLVSSRGQVVFLESFMSGSDGEDTRSIPMQYLKDMIPTARILVFAVVDQHVIADSVLVEMPKECREELQINPLPARSLQPKDRGQVMIEGGPGMTVGLVAVDKGVFALKYEKSLTRQTLYDSFASHDLGSREGSGANAVELFKSAGFILMYSQDHLLAIAGDMHSSFGRPMVQYSNDGSLENVVLRSFFPESWMFQEETLNADGEGTVNVTYPDSITTWIMYAIGVSSDKGVCVSLVKKVKVTKDFFVELSLPFKSIKLEEIRAKVTVSNYMYDTGVDLWVTADGLCMGDAQNGNQTFPRFTVPKGGRVTKTVTLLPVSAGTFSIRASAMIESGLVSDSVERKLVVACEGETNTKSISFNLNPSGEPRRDVTVRQSANNNTQTTYVDMAFPQEAIPESEKIKITASGDLLGDVIGQFVLGSNMPSDSDGVEGLMKELAPICYGVHYLAQLHALTPEVQHKGREHIRSGFSELLKYRTSQGAFSLDEYDPEFDMDPSAWFTAFVLKTLCTTRSVLDVDEDLIERGYNWLLSQIVRVDSRRYMVEEAFPRIPVLEQEQGQEQDHLMAEVLISSYGCAFNLSPEKARERNRIKRWYNSNQRRRLRRHSPLVLAKVTYTLLMMNGDSHYLWKNAARLLRNARIESAGYVFWSDEPAEEPSGPVFYQKRPTSETIEATAYSLLVFLRVAEKYRCTVRRAVTRRYCDRLYVDPEKIADWLVLWRNGDGLFIDTMDTAIATEALAKYRMSKRNMLTNLNVEVSTSPNETFAHSMIFQEEDAFTPKSINDVPLGQELEVVTAGSGLGYMHVDATYNTPIDVDADCRFDVMVYRNNQDINRLEDGLCGACGSNLTCPKADKFNCTVPTPTEIVNSIRTYCLTVCLRYHGAYDHGKLFVKVRMLSGYEPNQCDLQELKGHRVVAASYNREEQYVQIHLNQVSKNVHECVGFRINKVNYVSRVRPALISVRSYNVEEWTCPREYTVDDEDVSRPVYCALRVNNQRRECSCINDACVQWNRRESGGPAALRPIVRDSNYVFRLVAEGQEDHEAGIKHLIFSVEEERKSCLGASLRETMVIFITKTECQCVFRPGAEYWVIGKDYRTYTDTQGNTEYRFPLSENTFLLSSRRASDFNRDSDYIRLATRNSQCPS